MVLIGKQARLQTRLHSESSIIEMMYFLRNFGILDFPLSHTGTIKTKNMYDFIRARTAIDRFRRERCKQQAVGTGVIMAFTTDDPPGTECPETNCVIFGNTKKHSLWSLRRKRVCNVAKMCAACVIFEVSYSISVPVMWAMQPNLFDSPGYM